MNTELIKLAGHMIATGRGTRKNNSDAWSGVIEMDGTLYAVSVNWPDHAEANEAEATVREIKTTSRQIWTADEIRRK